MDRYYSRKFLNRRGHFAGSFILARVEKTDPETVDYHPVVHLEIADCSRQVSFDFPLYTRAERSNSVRKARMLAEVLHDFADALAIEAEIQAGRPKIVGFELDPFVIVEGD